MKSKEHPLKKYIKDSVYKVLAYLKDFEGVSFTRDIPGVIACWDGIKMENSSNPFNQNILILNKDDFLDNIKVLFSLDLD